MAKKKRVRLTSPKGIAKYPWLNKPDTKFDPSGVFRVSLLFDPEEVQPFLDRLDEMADEAFEETKADLLEKGNKLGAKQLTRNDPYEMEIDRETAEETGKVEVKFKMKHLIKTKDGEIELTPSLFDAQGKSVDRNEVNVFGGSILRVNFTPRKYYVAGQKMAGVSLQLNAVQIIELAERGGNADYYGFGVEEDGFSADDADSGGDFSADTGDDDFDVTEEDF
jgi:hypothetical protein